MSVAERIAASKCSGLTSISDPVNFHNAEVVRVEKPLFPAGKRVEPGRGSKRCEHSRIPCRSSPEGRLSGQPRYPDFICKLVALDRGLI
jgi:hypothetical protein